MARNAAETLRRARGLEVQFLPILNQYIYLLLIIFLSFSSLYVLGYHLGISSKS